MSAGIILFAAFAVCLIVGVPVSISLGVASLCSVVFGGLSASSTVIAQRIFGGLQSTSIMAIAFFVLAGNLMTKGGISRRIVNFANCLVGNVRGGMSLALVLACAFFAALSGSAPATVIAIGTMLYNDMVKLGYPGDRTAGLLVVSGGLGPIIPPSIILVGIYSSMLTATESAAIAVVWAAIAGLFIYKELTVKELVPILKDSAKSSAMILFIIAASTAFSWVFTFSGASQALVNAVISMHLNSALFCFVVAIILLIFGTFMEGTAIAVLLVPVLWPIAQSMGIDVIHFGMIVCISNVVGTMTPPVALNIFSASTVSGLKMGDIAKAEIPFLIGYVAVFFCCVFSETFCTFLI
ncbi:MAG: TRAP transporter large permease [Enterocloster sp.]|nr:TRAP transporter large permease [Enterocloster sp.]